MPEGLLRAVGVLLVSSSVFGLSSGCAASQYEPSAFERQSEPCGRPRLAQPSARRARALTEEERAVLRDRYSTSAVDTALLIDAAPAIVDLERLRTEKASLERQLAAEAGVDAEVLSAQLELESTEAAVECELHRVEHAMEVQKEDDDDLNHALTTASIAVAAATAVAGSALIPVEDTEGAQAGIGVSGGVVAGAIGIAQLLVEADTTLQHERSVLRDVWLLPAPPAVVSPMVAAFLLLPEEGAATKSRREQLIATWQRAGWLGTDAEERADRQALLFGKGGEYTANELLARRGMLNDVKVTIKGMNVALRTLAVQVRSRRGASLTSPESGDHRQDE